MIKRIAIWVGLLVIIAATLAVLREPLFWKRYAIYTVHGKFGVPLSFYEPSWPVPGAATPPLPRVTPEEQGIDEEALQAAVEYAGANGSDALIVTRNGHIVFEQYWNGTSYDTVTSTDAFAATLAALLIGAALDDAIIGSIDEPAANYIKEWQSDSRRDIRIRDLLQMSSGLHPPSEGSHPRSESVRYFLGSDILAQLMGRPLTERPGRKWVYQDNDPQALALVIERASGKPYAEYLREKLWSEVEAANAWLWLDGPRGTPHAACCLLAKQGDWTRIAEILLNDGVYLGEEIVPPGWVRQMLAPAPGNPAFGFQLWRGSPFLTGTRWSKGSEPYATELFFLDGGGKDRLWLVPSLRLAILRTGTGAQAEEWDDARIPNLIIRGVREFLRSAPGSQTPDVSTLVPRH